MGEFLLEMGRKEGSQEWGGVIMGGMENLSHDIVGRGIYHQIKN